MTNPSRPRIIHIPNRSASLQQGGNQLGSYYNLGPVPNSLNVTPPETPEDLSEGHDWFDKEAWGGARRVIEGVDQRSKPPITPPNSPDLTPKAAYLHQPNTCDRSSNSHIRFTARYQPTDWILDELEFSVANFPHVRLLLDSPVIQHLRYLSSEGRSAMPLTADAETSTSRVPRSRYSVNSRLSLFKPLSSHPVSQPQKTVGPQEDLQLPNAIHAPSASTRKNSAMSALGRIFPDAVSSDLDCVQATFIALHYLSASNHAFSSAYSRLQHPSRTRHRHSSSSVPLKPREMLG